MANGRVAVGVLVWLLGVAVMATVGQDFAIEIFIGMVVLHLVAVKRSWW